MHDLVGRQAVKDWLTRWEGYIDKDIIARMQYRVIDIPSAQPEIIYCRECKYFNSYFVECNHESGLRHIKDDHDHCCYAERREE